MVKVGFICEGRTEAILLSSDNFNTLLNLIGIEKVNVIDAKGSGNLLPKNINGYIISLENSGADVILILTDLDEDVCITKTKDRINARTKDIVVVSVKKIESWFLANTLCMKKFFSDDNFFFEFPENESEPFETINNLMLSKTGPGIGKKPESAGKIKLVNRLLLLGLDLSYSVQHPNCSSAKYFMSKLSSVGHKSIGSAE